MKPPVTVTIERDSIQADVADLEKVERVLLDTMLMLPSTRAELEAALHQIHSVAYGLRLHLEEGPKS